MKKKNSYENLQEDIRKVKMPKIDVWENKYPDREYTIELEIPEFTCICPKTGLPDFAIIYLTYSPNEACLELKSLKQYILKYRDLGIFHEHLVNRILDDVVKACNPRWVEIEAEMNPRGGIGATVSAEYFEDEDK